MTDASAANRLSGDEIHAYWREQASEHGLSPAASWSDVRVIELEVATIGPYLARARALDVGCANGYSSIRFAAEHDADVLGIDYVEEMIEAAEKRRSGLPPPIRERVEFRVGDVRSLELADGEYERVVSTRVMINLGDWEGQQQGLRECVRVLRPGGLLLLSEATVGGWSRLNALRREWGLDEIPMPGFNIYLREEAVVALLEPEAELVELVDFASSYYVATRVLKPLLARAAEVPVDIADPDAEFNRWAARLPAAGDYGTQKLFVFRKR
ncbi:MAG: class I SAM-dependent methyltransferase [Solirubrobacterales bacterium]